MLIKELSRRYSTTPFPLAQPSVDPSSVNVKCFYRENTTLEIFTESCFSRNFRLSLVTRSTRITANGIYFTTILDISPSNRTLNEGFHFFFSFHGKELTWLTNRCLPKREIDLSLEPTFAERDRIIPSDSLNVHRGFDNSLKWTRGSWALNSSSLLSLLHTYSMKKAEKEEAVARLCKSVRSKRKPLERVCNDGCLATLNDIPRSVSN